MGVRVRPAVIPGSAQPSVSQAGSATPAWLIDGDRAELQLVHLHQHAHQQLQTSESLTSSSSPATPVFPASPPPLPSSAGGAAAYPVFAFDCVFPPPTLDGAVYERLVAPLVDCAVRGINGTVFAYGQTSSGKTYTMTQMRRLAAEHLFSAVQALSGWRVTVTASFLEVYNEQLRDLLPPLPSACSARLRIREHPALGVHVTGLREEEVRSAPALLQLSALADSHRAVASTAMNERSSRAHSICRITIRSRGERETRQSSLQLIDLAGSEVTHSHTHNSRHPRCEQPQAVHASTLTPPTVHVRSALRGESDQRRSSEGGRPYQPLAADAQHRHRQTQLAEQRLSRTRTAFFSLFALPSSALFGPEQLRPARAPHPLPRLHSDSHPAARTGRQLSHGHHCVHQRGTHAAITRTTTPPVRLSPQSLSSCVPLLCCALVLFAAVQSSGSVDESLSTLRFALQAKQLRTTARVNAVVDPKDAAIAQLQRSLQERTEAELRWKRKFHRLSTSLHSTHSAALGCEENEAGRLPVEGEMECGGSVGSPLRSDVCPVSSSPPLLDIVEEGGGEVDDEDERRLLAAMQRRKEEDEEKERSSMQWEARMRAKLLQLQRRFSPPTRLADEPCIAASDAEGAVAAVEDAESGDLEALLDRLRSAHSYAPPATSAAATSASLIPVLLLRAVAPSLQCAGV